MQIENFCSLKAHIKWIKRQGTYQEKIFANLLSDKGLVPPVYKELSKLNCRKVNHSNRKWAKDTGRHVSEEDIQISHQKNKLH